MRGLIVLATALCTCAALSADEKTAEGPQVFRHHVVGLFSPDRAEDLREATGYIPEVCLVKVDFANGEAEFRYDPAKAFPGAKPEQIVERFNNLMQHHVPHSTFGIRKLREKPLAEYTYVEIPIAGLDCKGCAYAAYDAVIRVEGVERATADFRQGLATAHFDPAKTNREAIEAALKQRGVELKGAEAK